MKKIVVIYALNVVLLLGVAWMVIPKMLSSRGLVAAANALLLLLSGLLLGVWTAHFVGMVRQRRRLAQDLAQFKQARDRDLTRLAEEMERMRLLAGGDGASREEEKHDGG